MARSPRHGSIAFVAEVARFLCVEPEDVRRMIQLDKLPAVRIPVKTKTVDRIPLRDFQAWLARRSVNPTPQLMNFETFLEDFDRTVRFRDTNTLASIAPWPES